jgi:hypothetical protein
VHDSQLISGLEEVFFMVFRQVRSCRNRRKTMISGLIALVTVSLNCFAQAGPSNDEWGEKFNTAGVELILKETGRSRVSGKTVVAYSLFASGLPLDAHYTLWTRLLGSDPQVAAEALLNDEGKVVSQLADPEHGIVEDPIDLKVFGGRGEPKQFGLISKDGKFRAFAQVVPFPIESSDGPCHLSAVMTGRNYYGVFIGITGLQPGEDLVIDTHSDSEGGGRKGKATDQGTYDSALFPFVKGKRSGRVRFNVKANSCNVSVELPWGEGSYELQ